jgi:Flp pilus assembly protein TadD
MNVVIFDTSKNSWHHINKGISWINYNDLKKAVSHFDKALNLEPDNLVAQLHKGM